MWSVKNDEESLETAAVAAARERVVTACSMWASVEARLALQIKLTAWTCKARRPRTAGSQDSAKRRLSVLCSGKSFSHAVCCVERAVSSHAPHATCGGAASASAREHKAFRRHNLPTVPRTFIRCPSTHHSLSRPLHPLHTLTIPWGVTLLAESRALD